MKPFPRHRLRAARVAVVLLATLALGTARAEPAPSRPDLRLDLRYDVIDGGAVRDRLQTALRYRHRVGLSDRFDLVGFVATGDDFASRWVTLADFRPGRSETDAFRPRLRQLYVEYRDDRVRAQAGVVPPVKAVISPTGLDPVGWIDGARFEWFNAPGGTVEFVAGRLGDVDRPGLFVRRTVWTEPDRVNYFEVESSQQVVSWLRIETSFEVLHDVYLRGELRWTPRPSIEMFTEALHNTATGSVNHGTTVVFDPLAFWRPSAAGRAELALNHSYIGRDIGLRGELADDFFTYGHSVTIEPGFVLSEHHGLELGGEIIVAEQPAGRRPAGFFEEVYTRVNVVLGWRLP